MFDKPTECTTDAPFLLRGVLPSPEVSDMMLSTSKYLAHPKLRDWVAMILLRSNGDYYKSELEMRDLPSILNELRDYERIEHLITEERKVNEPLDRWMSEGFISSYKIEDFKDYAPDTVGGLFHNYITTNAFPVYLMEWKQPKSQFEFFLLRSGQTHDFEHIICGGGFDYMGELVPYWFRLTNQFKHLKNKELAGELSVLYMLGSLRYTVRTMLYYPQVWETCVKCIQRGMKVGEESDALFMAKYEDVFHLTIAEARKAVGARGVEDVDTSQSDKIWTGRVAA